MCTRINFNTFNGIIFVLFNLIVSLCLACVPLKYDTYEFDFLLQSQIMLQKHQTKNMQKIPKHHLWNVVDLFGHRKIHDV